MYTLRTQTLFPFVWTSQNFTKDQGLEITGLPNLSFFGAWIPMYTLQVVSSNTWTLLGGEESSTFLMFLIPRKWVFFFDYRIVI